MMYNIKIIVCIFFIFAVIQVISSAFRPVMMRNYPKHILVSLREKGYLTCPDDALIHMDTSHDIKIFDSVDRSLVMLLEDCGPKKYLATKYLVKFEDIWSECGKYGMVPATFQSLNELECINRNYVKQRGTKTLSLMTMTYHLTSYIDVEGLGNFSSCVTGQPVPADFWMYRQPDNLSRNESCVAIALQYLSETKFYDVPCDYKKLAVICQYSDEIKNMLTKNKEDGLCLRIESKAKDCKLKSMPEEQYMRLVLKLNKIVSLVRQKKRNNVDLDED